MFRSSELLAEVWLVQAGTLVIMFMVLVVLMDFVFGLELGMVLVLDLTDMSVDPLIVLVFGTLYLSILHVYGMLVMSVLLLVLVIVAVLVLQMLLLLLYVGV